MDCSDHILLQRLLDSELDDAQAEMVSRHLATCAACRAVTKEMTLDRGAVQEKLGEEDECEDDAAAAILATVAARLPFARPDVRQITQRSGSEWLRRRWLAAAAVAMFVLVLPLPFTPGVTASPDRVLEEAVARERMWEYQPNKVLHWEVEAISNGVKGIADGRWRSLYWQKNGGSTFEQIWRQFDPHDRIVRATWRQDDGSVVSYRRDTQQVVEVLPSTAAARAALPTLSEELRGALQAYLERRETLRTLEFHSRREAEWLNRPAVGTTRGAARLRRGTIAEWGEIYYITVVDEKPRINPMILRAVHEYHVEKSTYRLLRLKSTISYTDGTTGVHEGRRIGFREISAAEFDAQTPRDLLEGGRRVVTLTPLDLATRHLQELNRARTSPN